MTSQFTRRTWLKRTLLTGLMLSAPNALSRDRQPTIAAASSLRHVLPAIAKAFAATGQAKPRLTFGSSGNLYRQVVQGAPFGVFLSADTELPAEIEKRDLTAEPVRDYALGRIALVTPRVKEALTSAEVWKDAVAANSFRRLAIANPKHAPYGKAAIQVLESFGLKTDLKNGFIIGENASQAAQFLLTGSVDGALLPLALARSKRLANRTTYVVLEANAHEPIRHGMALISHANPGERAFYRFMTSTTAQALLNDAGFERPRP